MVYEIAWTATAIKTFEECIKYIQDRWTDREIKNFAALVDDKIKLLSTQPNIGRPRNKKHPDIRITILHKRVSLIYRVTAKSKRIEILFIWNNYKHPARLKF